MNAHEMYIGLEQPMNVTINENLSLSNGHLFKYDKSGISTTDSINNYLKTPEEMEAEFSFVINTRRAAFQEKDDSFDTFGRLKMKTDGYMNIPNLEETFSGFMEENY